MVSAVPQIRVLVVDDHPAMRLGVASVLAIETDIEIVGEAANGADAIALFEVLGPDVVLMDLRMPKLNGIAAITAIRELDPGARVLALTTYDDDADIQRALNAGACDYLIKDAMIDRLVDAIRSAARRDARHPRRQSRV